MRYVTLKHNICTVQTPSISNEGPRLISNQSNRCQQTYKVWKTPRASLSNSLYMYTWSRANDTVRRKVLLLPLSFSILVSLSPDSISIPSDIVADSFEKAGEFRKTYFSVKIAAGGVDSIRLCTLIHTRSQRQTSDCRPNQLPLLSSRFSWRSWGRRSNATLLFIAEVTVAALRRRGRWNQHRYDGRWPFITMSTHDNAERHQTL